MAPKRDVSGSEGDGKDKAKWNDKKTEIFLKACVEEILTGNRPNTHFSKEGWKNVERKFYEKTGNSHDRKQLKNKWNSLKKDFSSFAKLVEKETGLGWDHEKRTIQASEEWWTEKGKEDPEILKWKNGGPKFLELMNKCFKGVVATGFAVLLPYQDPPLDIDGNNEVDEDNDDNLSRSIEGDSKTIGEPTPNPKKRKRVGKGKKVGTAEKLQKSLDHILDGLDQMSHTSVTKAKPDDPCSYDKCLALINDVPGLMKGSSQYFLACRILSNKDNRVAFMHFMENDRDMTIGWLNTFKDEDIRL